MDGNEREPARQTASRPASARGPTIAAAAVSVLALLVAGTAVGLTLRTQDDLAETRAVLAERTEALDTLAADHTAVLDELDSRSATLASDLGALTGRLDGNDSVLTELGDRLTAVDGRVTEVDDRVGGILDATEVTEAATPSIVTIYCELDGSQGSGFALVGDPPAGYGTVILTNHHVVAGCIDGEVAVETTDGRETGLVWEWDDANDIASVVVDAALPGLEAAETAVVGQPVVAIGSPYGFTGTTTQGIVTKTYTDGVTTDAAIDPGNSGGPLLDRDAKVIGITTARILDADGLNVAVGLWQACETVLACEP